MKTRVHTASTRDDDDDDKKQRRHLDVSSIKRNVYICLTKIAAYRVTVSSGSDEYAASVLDGHFHVIKTSRDFSTAQPRGTGFGGVWKGDDFDSE